MTSSRVKGLITALGVICCLSVLPASAQVSDEATGKPRSILPRAPVGDDAGRAASDLDLPDFPDTIRPDADALPEDGEATTEDARTSDIEIMTLEAEAAVLGTLDPGDGGFSADLWAGTDAATALDLLNIADPGASRATQDLARRVVLTAAPGPEGIDDGAFLAARLNLLARMGALEAILELTNRAGARAPVPGAERVKLDALLLAEDFLGACNYAADQIGRQTDPYWLQAVAFCRALDGDRPGANLSLELLQEQAIEAPVYYKLIGALLERADTDLSDETGVSGETEPPTIVSMRDTNALVLRLARLLDVRIPVDVIEGATPLVMTELAALPSLPLAVRAEAGYAAALDGGYEAGRLAQIYRAMPVTPEERANATLLAETADAVRARALFYQAALAGGNAMTRAIALVRGAEQAREDGSMALYAAVNREALITMPPSEQALPVAADLVRLMLLAGERKVAQAWYRQVRDMGISGNGDARAALVAMWPLVVIGNGDAEVPVSGEILDLWWQSRTGVSRDRSALQAELLYGFFDALGHGIPDAFWPQILGSRDAKAGPTATPSLTVWRGLLKAASEGDRGGVALHALAALSAGGPGLLAPDVVVSIVRSLAAVGLEREARAIALEAMVAHGL